MSKFRLGLCGAVALLGAVCLPIPAADAATVTDSYSFSASGFLPSGSPFSTWDGSFTITFNPTLSGAVGPLALDAFSSNLPASYGTFMYGQNTNEVTVGDNCGLGGCSVAGGTNQAFLAFFVNASGVPSPISAVLSATSTGNIFVTTSPTETLVTTPSTPLPAALPLFATGLGALGLLGWRRKRKARVSLLAAA